MARSRNIKPGFFKNEFLAEMPCEVRLLFIGLWTLADREGRLEDRPRKIKAELFAFDSFDVDPMLDRLKADGFIVRYEHAGRRLMQITNFVKHQDPHYREKASDIPPPPGHEDKISATAVTRSDRERVLERDGYTCQHCGATDGLCIDHVLPVSRGGTSDYDNLQVLCISCNTRKGNKLAGESKNITKPNKSSVKANKSRIRVEVGSKNERYDPLIPDSLIPDSLIPEEKLEANASVAGSLPDDDQDDGQDRPGIPNCPAQKLVALYAKHLPMLTQPRVWDGARAKAMTARWRQCARGSPGVSKGYTTEADGLAYWDRFFRYVSQSQKLTEGIPYADPSRPPWSPDLPWLMKAENFAKVIEGKYHEREAA